MTSAEYRTDYGLLQLPEFEDEEAARLFIRQLVSLIEINADDDLFSEKIQSLVAIERGPGVKATLG